MENQKNKPKVFVAILNMGSVCAGLESSVFKWMVEKGDKYQFTFHLRKKVPTSSNRNDITRDFLKSGCDYLAMFDEDTYPLDNPFDILDHDKDVCGCVYPGMGESGIRLHVYRRLDDGTYGQYPPKERSGLMEVDAIGTGAIFIKRKVLEKIKKPFDYTFDKDGVTFMSDDIAFCKRAKDKGFKIWADWDKAASHYKVVDLLQVSNLIAEAAMEKKIILK